MKKIITILLTFIIGISMAACGNNGTSIAEKIDTKGTRENPYTLEDTVTVTSTAWEGNRLFNGVPIGTNTFELSNLRIEPVNVTGLNGSPAGTHVNCLIFDKKCIETCYENGIDYYNDLQINNFFNPNMQSLSASQITDYYAEHYIGKNQPNETLRVYFEGTTYTEAYALCELSIDGVVPSDETYHLARILCYDENLDEKYVYIKLD